MDQWYKCPGCRESVLFGTATCPACKKGLGWRKGGGDPFFTRSFEIGVKGESHNNADGSSRQAILGHCVIGEKVKFIAEPTNPVDHNAVKICRLNGEQIGYVSKLSAPEFAEVIKRGIKQDAEISQIKKDGDFINCWLKITRYDDDLTWNEKRDLQIDDTDTPAPQPVVGTENKKGKSGNTSKLVIGCGATIVALLLIGGLASAFNPKKAEPPPDPALQEQRYQAIQELESRGLFDRIEKGEPFIRIWVNPVFYALKLTEKETFMGVIYAYYHGQDPKYEALIIYDSYSGKTIGHYGAAYGGLKLE